MDNELDNYLFSAFWNRYLKLIDNDKIFDKKMNSLLKIVVVYYEGS